jgi:hypothetical protein
MPKPNLYDGRKHPTLTLRKLSNPDMPQRNLFPGANNTLNPQRKPENPKKALGISLII